MLFPFASPSDSGWWGLEQYARTVPILYPSATLPCQTGEGWCVAQHHSTGQPLVWWDQPIQIAGSFTGTGINCTHNRSLGSLITPSTGFNQPRSDIKTEMLRSLHKWLLYTMRMFFKAISKYTGALLIIIISELLRPFYSDFKWYYNFFGCRTWCDYDLKECLS